MICEIADAAHWLGRNTFAPAKCISSLLEKTLTIKFGGEVPIIVEGNAVVNTKRFSELRFEIMHVNPGSKGALLTTE